MRVYLAATNNYRNIFGQDGVRTEDVYLLESFYSLDEWQKVLIPRCKGFMLDSGAFTFMNSQNGSSIDWLSYADRYADFIKEHDVRQYSRLVVVFRLSPCGTETGGRITSSVCVAITRISRLAA